MTPVQQGDIYYCHFDEPVKSRPILVLSRTEINAVRDNVVVALVTRTIRGIPLEVPVGKAEGLPKEGVVSMGDIYTVSKNRLSERKGQLSTEKWDTAVSAMELLFGLA